jgi:hypothetical protein
MPNPYALTQGQIDKIVIDEGIIYINFGEVGSEAKLGPVRGGGEFSATPTYRDIPFDGQRGKTSGFKVIEELNAMLKVTLLSHDQQQMAKLLPFVDVGASTPYDITSGDTALVASTKFLKNVTLFAKTLDGKFKKITLYNALNEAPWVVNAKPKSESEMALEFHAHWDPITITNELFKVEEVASITT